VFAHDYHYDNNTPHYDIPNWVNTDRSRCQRRGGRGTVCLQTVRTAARHLPALPELSLGVGAAQTWDREFRFTPTTDEILRRVRRWTPAAWATSGLSYEPASGASTVRRDVPTDPGVFVRSISPTVTRLLRADGQLSHRSTAPVRSPGASVEDDTRPRLSAHERQAGRMAVDFGREAGPHHRGGDYGQDRFEWSMASRYRASRHDDPLTTGSRIPTTRRRTTVCGVNHISYRQDHSRTSTGQRHGRDRGAMRIPSSPRAGDSNGGQFPDNNLSRNDDSHANDTWNLAPQPFARLRFTVEYWSEATFHRDLRQPR
jgi:hypothetical protein